MRKGIVVLKCLQPIGHALLNSWHICRLRCIADKYRPLSLGSCCRGGCMEKTMAPTGEGEGQHWSVMPNLFVKSAGDDVSCAGFLPQNRASCHRIGWAVRRAARCATDSHPCGVWIAPWLGPGLRAHYVQAIHCSVFDGNGRMLMLTRRRQACSHGSAGKSLSKLTFWEAHWACSSFGPRRIAFSLCCSVLACAAPSPKADIWKCRVCGEVRQFVRFYIVYACERWFGCVIRIWAATIHPLFTASAFHVAC